MKSIISPREFIEENFLHLYTGKNFRFTDKQAEWLQEGSAAIAAHRRAGVEFVWTYLALYEINQPDRQVLILSGIPEAKEGYLDRLETILAVNKIRVSRQTKILAF